MRLKYKILFPSLIISLLSTFNVYAQMDNQRPNIVLILAEDLSSRVGFAGDRLANTPNLDAIAEQSLIFDNAFTAAGVCAPNRSATIMGAHMQTLGTMHMRTSSADRLYGPGYKYEAVTPPNVKAFPELLRAAGYYVANNAKTDYQIGNPFTIWDETGSEAHWRKRPDGKPFFFYKTIGVTHESYTWPPSMNNGVESAQKDYKRNAEFDEGKTHFTDRSQIEIPPYYPDTEKVRETIGRQYDNVNMMDKMFGEVIKQLEEDNLLDNTIIIWSTDHGDGLPRAKRSLYDAGIKVPFFIRFPDGYRKNERTDEMISFVDLAATILSWAGAERPDFLQGHVIAGPSKDKEAEYIYAAADRFDGKPSKYKAVRSKRYKYIRNYMTDIPFYQHLAYRDNQPLMQSLWKGLEEGTLTQKQAAMFEPGPAEEFYDINNDPHEMNNIADDEEFIPELNKHREAMDNWIASGEDYSVMPEDELIESMWPGLVQPITLPVNFNMMNGKTFLISDTEGASIGYRTIGQNEWKLYTSPLTLDEPIEAKAIRYGYKESEISSSSD
ncbi:MAG: sulfatase [Kordiimonadaceae bacterium]|jgi:N-sulfoglucosamine sulfohydrolase|nr:sulfatase [Kordiimonadaceae bacterium]MBT6031222.1 sulfatase [Kordiimonadaceae bacterium]